MLDDGRDDCNEEVADKEAIVSSKELNLVKFIIQPSNFLSSFSSLNFCQDTFNVVDETASTMTSSGWPGNVLMPSATPVSRRKTMTEKESERGRYERWYKRLELVVVNRKY